ncbi:protein kinase [Paenibacillus sp. TAB 01]|uniref:protein kinase domain-containing protein n=1 Tax=Paenibacillus sp. TAB 01 TaxID=3368988 RepID=UPI003751CC9C
MSKNNLTVLLQRLRSQPGFDRLLYLFEEKFRSYGSFGKVEISNPMQIEIDTLRGLMGRKIRIENNKVTVKATDFEQAILDAGFEVDLHSLLEAYAQQPLRTKRKIQEEREEEKEQFFQYFMQQPSSDGSFYKFISFIKEYNNAPSIHIMYKKNPDLLWHLLGLINKMFCCLPLSNDVFLPVLAHELTDDFHALNPKSDGGKIMLFALQVLNYLNAGEELFSKPTEEQIKELLQGYHILFCPDATRITHRLWISKEQNEAVHNYNLIALEKIGEGAFAEVYRVFDPVLKKEVACKVLFEKSYFLSEYGKEGEDYLQRFKKEVRILKDKIIHPNIIDIYNVELEQERILFTMPLAENSLEKWLELNPGVSNEVRISIFKDILSGVAYLHDCEINHRDLAPHNILLFKNEDGTVLAKVADFGLAKDHRSLSASTSLSVGGYGRWGFAAPEQMKSLKNADHLSDIYSLGTLLYYLFAGEPPSPRFKTIINHHLIIAKAMEEERSKRYQTVSELMDDINSSLAKESHSFLSLSIYGFQDFFVDVAHVLDCMTAVRIEASNEVFERFIRPLISIPLEVLKECIKNEKVMIPFMNIARENISRLEGCSEEDWNQISLRIAGVFRGTQNLGLQTDAIYILMVVALEVNNNLAQLILVEIMRFLVSYSKISVQMAQLIEKHFFSYHELLISILKDIHYPIDIRDVLNDY